MNKYAHIISQIMVDRRCLMNPDGEVVKEIKDVVNRCFDDETSWGNFLEIRELTRGDNSYGAYVLYHYINNRLNDLHINDLFLEKILDKYHKIGIKDIKPFLKPIISNCNNILRDEGGDLRHDNLFKMLANHANSEKLFKLIVKNDDVEAWETISSLPEYKVYFEQDRLNTLLKRNPPEANSKVFKSILGDLDSTDKAVVDRLIKIGKESVDSALAKYDCNIAKSHGWMIIVDYLEKKTTSKSKTHRAVAQKLIEDGADLFMAFKTIQDEYFVSEPYKNRVVKLDAELAYMKKYAPETRIYSNPHTKMLFDSLVSAYKDAGKQKEKERTVDTTPSL